MSRSIPVLSSEEFQIIERWRVHGWYDDRPWAHKRVEIVLKLQWESCAAVAREFGVNRKTVSSYLKIVKSQGVFYLTRRRKAGVPKALTVEQEAALITEMVNARLKRIVDVRRWILENTGRELSERGVRKIVHRMKDDSRYKQQLREPRAYSRR